LVGALVVAVTAVLGVPMAGAGTYDVVACNAPGAHGVNNSWSWSVGALPIGSTPAPEDEASYALGGSCASSSGLRGGSNPNGPATVRWGTSASFHFVAPADTDIVRVTLWRYGIGRLGADTPGTPENESGRFELTAMYGPGNSVFADSCQPGAGIFPNPCQIGSPGFSAASKVVHEGRADTFDIGIFCGGDQVSYRCNTNDGTGNPYSYVDLQGAAVTLEDNTKPRITASGSLLTNGWRRPSDSLSVNTTDNSGIRLVRLEADGRIITTRIQPCDGTRPIPCRGTVNGTRLTGAGIPDGTHSLRIVSLDAAKNLGVIERALHIDGTPPTAILERARGRKIVLGVRDATSGVASAGIEIRNRSTEPYRAIKSTLRGGKLRATLDAGNAGKTDVRVTVRDNAGNVTRGNPTRLSATSAKVGRRFRRVRSGRVKVPFGRSATLRGRLTLSAGQPFAGQTVTATSTVRRRGARAQPAGSAVTDRRGRFAIKVPAGPSRNYRLVFSGAGDGLGAARGVSVRVPASSTIRASRTRLSGPARVRFSGRLRNRGQRIPGRGLLLVLQGREGGKWRTFEDTRTNRKGRWHVSYGFSGRPGLYPIRVRIRRQSGYPFELGYSRKLPIRVG
jgi:hypothetical protein